MVKCIDDRIAREMVEVADQKMVGELSACDWFASIRCRILTKFWKFGAPERKVSFG